MGYDVYSTFYNQNSDYASDAGGNNEFHLWSAESDWFPVFWWDAVMEGTPDVDPTDFGVPDGAVSGILTSGVAAALVIANIF